MHCPRSASRVGGDPSLRAANRVLPERFSTHNHAIDDPNALSTSNGRTDSAPTARLCGHTVTRSGWVVPPLLPLLPIPPVPIRPALPNVVLDDAPPLARLMGRPCRNGGPQVRDDLVMANNRSSTRHGRAGQPRSACGHVAAAGPTTVSSAVMSSTTRRWLATAAAAVIGAGTQLVPATALADPDSGPTGPQTEIQPAPGDQLKHNITYRARADGTSRGAVVAYKIDDTNTNSETPTLLPGITFEVNTVLDDPRQAGMEISIQWPYGSNLHCEILADDQIVAQADQFIAPRLFHPKDDPLYGVLQCGAPLDTPAASQAPALEGAAAPAAPPAEAPAAPAT